MRWAVRIIGVWLFLSVIIVLALRFIAPPSSAFMLERWLAAQWHGERNFNLRYRWTPLNDVSGNLLIALVAAEDQKFPYHHGFDIAAIEDAISDAEEGGPVRGASTISQQVAKNLFLWSGRSYFRKGLEAYFTVLIEILWSKQRILEVYVNIAEFGNGIYGAAAASDYFFGVSPARIDAHQACLLAAVLPNPQRYRANKPSPYVAQRAFWIQKQVRQLGGISYLPK